MQDNLVKDFLAQENVHVLLWPAQSPDLNPIWALIKRKLTAEFSIPKSRSELIANLEGISPELCINLSVSTRLEKVLQNKKRSTLCILNDTNHTSILIQVKIQSDIHQNVIENIYFDIELDLLNSI